MTETKFTPGPWSVEDGDVHHKGYLVITAKGMGLSTPLAQVGGADWDEASRPDAHLIAAAPDLYAALTKSDELIVHAQAVLAEYLPPDGMSAQDALNLLLGLLDGPDQREVQNATRAALSKARGQT